MASKKKPKVLKDLKDIPSATKRPKQTDMPLKGEGVETVTDKQLIQLGDEFIDVRDNKAVLATKLKETETKILDRMDILGIKEFRFSDQIVTSKTGARHVKVKTVKVECEEPESSAEPDLGEEQK
jgi:hypothetical protein